jgi:hypothetical protein
MGAEDIAPLSSVCKIFTAKIELVDNFVFQVAQIAFGFPATLT